MVQVTHLVLYHTRADREYSQYKFIPTLHSKCQHVLGAHCEDSSRLLNASFQMPRTGFIAAFEANIVPAALKLAGASKNDNIRLLSLLPTGATSG
jgi:hypothetical protein